MTLAHFEEKRTTAMIVFPCRRRNGGNGLKGRAPPQLRSASPVRDGDAVLEVLDGAGATALWVATAAGRRRIE